MPGRDANPDGSGPIVPFDLSFDDFTMAEIEMISDMMRAGGFTCAEDVFRVAMWRFARHLQIDAPADVFELHRRLSTLRKQGKLR